MVTEKLMSMNYSASTFRNGGNVVIEIKMAISNVH